jgi:tRNA1Val (adenine37-N6)-methyltransferase
MKKLPQNDSSETLDALFNGRLKVLQKKCGYRFSIDAFLLAHFAKPLPMDRIIDLGTGCGILPLILTFRHKVKTVIGVEIQPSLADLARRNIVLNRLSTRIKIWEKDLKSLEGKSCRGTFDLVLSNPPYRKVGSGRVNPRLEKAVARHEIIATLEDVIRTAGDLLKDKGRLSMIYPASRAADLIEEMRKFHLEPKRLQFVHSHPRDVARLLLVEGLKEGHAQVRVLPPLFLYDSMGKYTPEAQELFH